MLPPKVDGVAYGVGMGDGAAVGSPSGTFEPEDDCIAIVTSP
jgi:hypothetical protein